MISDNNFPEILSKIQTMSLIELLNISQKCVYRHRKESFHFIYEFSKKYKNENNYIENYIAMLFDFAVNKNHLYIIELILNDTDFTFIEQYAFISLKKSRFTYLRVIRYINQRFTLPTRFLSLILSKTLLGHVYAVNNEELMKDIKDVYQIGQLITSLPNFDISNFESIFHTEFTKMQTYGFSKLIYTKLNFLDFLIKNKFSHFITNNFPCFTFILGSEKYKAQYLQYVISQKIHSF